MIDNGKNNIFRGCYAIFLRNGRRGSSLMLLSVTVEGDGLENGKFGVTQRVNGH